MAINDTQKDKIKNHKEKIKEMRIEVLEKQIMEMQNKFDEIQKLLNNSKQIEEPKKRWKPELGERYIYVCYEGRVYVKNWDNDDLDNYRYLLGNIFQTSQEAEEYRKKIKIQAQFKNFVKERSEKLDWNNNQEKWFIYYDFCGGKIEFDTQYFTKCQGVIYASSINILGDAIAEIGEENVKKYILEVEE